MEIDGSLAVVTGAARGIGLATCRALLDAGARVAVCDIDAQAATAAAAGLGDRATAWTLDVRDAAAFSELIERIEREVGPVDILVNNAGIMPLGPFLEQSTESDRRQLDINLFGVLHGMRAALPGMQRRGRGHVVNIASVAGRVGTPFAAVYSASKFGVVGVTEAVRAEMQGTGVGFSYVMPALVKTELISGAGVPRYPPPLEPEDVAAAVVGAIRTGRVDVFVPRFSRLSVILPALTPRRVYEKVGKLFGLAEMFAHVDAQGRAAYRKRILEP